MVNALGRTGSGPSVGRLTSAPSKGPAKAPEQKSGSDDDKKQGAVGRSGEKPETQKLEGLLKSKGSEKSEKKDDDKKGEEAKGKKSEESKGKGKKEDKEKDEKGLPPGIAKKEGPLPPGIARTRGETRGEAPQQEGVKGAAEGAKQALSGQQQGEQFKPAAGQQNINQALNQALGGGSPFSNNLGQQAITPISGKPLSGGQLGGITQGGGTTAAINPNATATLSNVLNQPQAGQDPSAIINSNVLQSLKAGDTAGFITSLAGNVQSSLNNAAGLFFQLTG